MLFPIDTAELAFLTEAGSRGPPRRDAVFAATVIEGTAGARAGARDPASARAIDATLRGASLTKADCSEADLSGADVTGTTLDGACLRAASLTGVRGFKRARWIGVDLRDIDFTGAYLCRRFINDQNFIEAVSYTHLTLPTNREV